MKRLLSVLSIALVSVCLFFIAVYTSVELVAYNDSFYYNQYASDKTLEPTTELPLVVSPYAILNIENVYYMAGKQEYTDSMQCFRVGLMSRIEHLEFTADNIRDIAGYSKGFDLQRFIAEFIPGYGGPETDFQVRINKDKIGLAIETFGEGFHVASEDSEYLTLEITCNYDKMYLWAISNADIAQVLEPAAMRFKLKEYFDVHSWNYR